jgi:hypothetical protein
VTSVRAFLLLLFGATPFIIGFPGISLFSEKLSNPQRARRSGFRVIRGLVSTP